MRIRTARGQKAYEELFFWRVKDQAFVVQNDPFYLKARRVWEVEEPYYQLFEAALTQPDGDTYWNQLGEMFAESWLEDCTDLEGKELTRIVTTDLSAGELELQANQAVQPWYIHLEVNQVCNLKCDFCYVDKLPHVMGKPEMIDLALRRAVESGVLFLNISGGEPTLYKRLVPLIQDATRQGVAVTVRSNLLSLPRDIEALSGNRRVVFVTSFHHAEAREFDRIVQFEGARDKIFANVRRLRDLDIKVRAHVVAREDNAASLGELRAQIRELRIPYTITDHVMTFTGVSGEEAALPLQHKLNALKVRKEIEDEGMVRRRGVCSAAQGKMWLAVSGELFPCELFREQSLGSFVDRSLKDVLHSAEVERWRQEMIHTSEPAGCTSCSARNKCPRCPAMVYAEKRTTHSKHEPTCATTAEIHGLKYAPDPRFSRQVSLRVVG